ncbi:cytochrome P450 [Streptomyces sp. NPDC056254]|uniref:cytochrome P450 n=1 Tax=Streptomyces sp. NPDC056254 TaxID=3345763 RepID=UPI0035E27663
MFLAVLSSRIAASLVSSINEMQKPRRAAALENCRKWNQIKEGQTMHSPPDIFAPHFTDDPYRHFDVLREEFPVSYSEQAGGYFISRHSDVRQVLHDKTFTARPLQSRVELVTQGPVLAQIEGREHSAKRKIVVRSFTEPSLSRYHVGVIERNIEGLLGPLLKQESIDVVRDFGRKLSIYVMLDILGLPRSDFKQINEWCAGISKYSFSLDSSLETRAKAISCGRALNNYLTPVVQKRQNHPEGDLISDWCASEAGDKRMATDAIRVLCVNALVAAVEPTDKTLGLLMRHLIENPEQQDAVRSDRRLLAAAVAETLRCTPPVQIIPRQSERDTTFGTGHFVPAGSTIYCLLAAANRDPRVFTHPERFDIFRSDLGKDRSFAGAAEHFAFGSGRHFCAGAAFARAEIEMAANSLFDATINWRYAQGFRYGEDGIYTRGPKSLLLAFDRV